jgi:hypothetical protein
MDILEARGADVCGTNEASGFHGATKLLDRDQDCF